MQNPLYCFYKEVISKKYLQKVEVIFQYMGGSVTYVFNSETSFEDVYPLLLVDIELDVLKSSEIMREEGLRLCFYSFVSRNLSLTLEFGCVTMDLDFQKKLELQTLASSFLFQIQKFIFDKEYNYPYFMKGVFLLENTKEYINIVHKMKNSRCIFLNGSQKSEKHFIFLSLLYEFLPNIDILAIDKKIKMEKPFSYTLENSIYYFVPEIATMLLDEQKDFLQVQKKYKNIFLLSSYRIFDLKKLSLIMNDFVTLCEKNRIILSTFTYPDKKGVLYFLHAILPEVKQMIQIIPLLHYLEELNQEIDVNFFSRLKSYYYMLGDKHFAEIRSVISELESFIIIFLRKEFSLSQYEISDLLGISRGSLQHKLRKYNLLSKK